MRFDSHNIRTMAGKKWAYAALAIGLLMSLGLLALRWHWVAASPSADIASAKRVELSATAPAFAPTDTPVPGASAALPRPALVNAFIYGFRAAKQVRQGTAGSNEDTTLVADTPVADATVSPTTTPSGRPPSHSPKQLSPEERLHQYWSNRVRADYEPFFVSAEVSPEVRATIEAALVEERLTLHDIFTLGKQRSLTYAEHSTLRAEFTRETQEAINAQLTAEQFRAFKQHKSDLIVENLVAETTRQFVAKKVAYGPDTPAKLKQLLKTFPPGRADTDPMTSHVALKKLSPEQATILEQVLDRAYVRK